MRVVKHKYLKKQTFRFLMIFVFSIVLFSHAYAQDGDDDGGGSDPTLPGSGDPDLPLDGGVVVLIAAGVGYGIKKIVEAKQFKGNHSNLSSTEKLSETITLI